MQTLTAQWYNAVSTQLHLDPSAFQMVQGNIALGSTSPGLWALMDSIPPQSITQYWTPQGYKSFSSQYGSLIPRLQDPSYGQFQAAMGDYYSTWMTYVKATPPPAGTTILAYFQSWAQSNMPPDQAGNALSLYAAALNGPLAQANMAWAVAGGATGVKAFNQTIEVVDHTIAGAPSQGVQLDSTTESSDTSHTWAKGSVEGFYDLFFGEAGASYDAATSVVTEAGVNISVEFTHMATVPIMPLSQGSILAGPTTYNAWYVPAALSQAYQNNNYQVWQPGTPDWSSFFGDSGSLPRAATSLLVVDGITVSMQSKAAIAKASQQEVETSFEAGFFPFFGVSGKGGWTSAQSFNDSGQVVATAKCPVGNPQALGILQSSIEALISSADIQAALRGNRVHVGGSPLRFEQTASVAVPGAASALLGTVYVAWTALAQQGLHNFPVGAGVKDLIVNYVNTWATNNAPNWALGSFHQYQQPVPPFIATAQLANVNGNNRTVNITNFV